MLFKCPPSPVSSAKALVMAPLVGITIVLSGIYVSAFQHSWSSQYLNHFDISDVATTIGFTIGSIFTVLSSINKIYLCAKQWTLTLSLVVNMLLMAFGGIMLIMMAWSPYHIRWSIHAAGVITGISVTLLAQILDTIYWYTFCRFTGSVNVCCIVLTVYSSICVALSLSFFVLWMQSDEFVDGAATPWSEWMGILFTVLGFLTQTAHGVVIYLQLKDHEGYEPLRDDGSEGVIRHHDGSNGTDTATTGQAARPRTRMHL